EHAIRAHPALLDRMLLDEVGGGCGEEDGGRGAHTREPRPVSAASRQNGTMTRRAALTTIGGALVLGAIVLGILVVTLPEDATTGLDTAWNDAMAGLRAAWLVGAAHVLNDVGGGWIAIWVVPPLVALVLVAVRRRRAAVFAAAAFLLSAGLV